jgi:hypothetical protein
MGLPVSFLTNRAAICSHFTSAADRETLFVHSSTSQEGITGLFGGGIWSCMTVVELAIASEGELMEMISRRIHDFYHIGKDADSFCPLHFRTRIPTSMPKCRVIAPHSYQCMSRRYVCCSFMNCLEVNRLFLFRRDP